MSRRWLFWPSLVSVRPSIIRVAEIATTSVPQTNWSGSATFDASGTEPNRLLVVFLAPFDSNNSGALTVTQMDIGGTAATQKFGFIAPATPSRNLGQAVYYRIAPANNASLAIDWNIGTSTNFVSGKIYGVLLRDVHQTDPLPNGAQYNDSVAQAFVDLTFTLGFSLSKVIGSFSARGGDTDPHTTRGGSTIETTADTGTTTTSDSGHSVASEDGGAPGSHTIGVDLAVSDAGGGAAVEVRAA